MSLRTAFTLIPVEFTDMSSVRVLGFRRNWAPYPTHRPRIRFLFVRPAFAISFLQTPCYQDALAELLLLAPRRAETVDFHHQQCALSGAPIKKGQPDKLVPYNISIFA